jgi:hypothetical protein
MTSLTLEHLKTLSPAQLRAAWREQYRSPAPDIGPDLLRRGVAHKIQERRYGKLAFFTRRELDRIVTRLEQDGEAGNLSPPKLKPGNRLIRSWHGTVHHVLVLADGFEHEGRSYRSLNQIARAITGAHWSGPRFFGLVKTDG